MTVRIKGESEHGYNGTRQHESASYEGTVFVCLCGEPFMDRNDLNGHVTDALGQDAFQTLLQDAARLQDRLRASRDDAAILASTKSFQQSIRKGR